MSLLFHVRVITESYDDIYDNNYVEQDAAPDNEGYCVEEDAAPDIEGYYVEKDAADNEGYLLLIKNICTSIYTSLEYI